MTFDSKTRAVNLDVDSLSEIDLFSTDPIVNLWPPRMRIRLTSNRTPQDYFAVGPLNIVSCRFVELCRRFLVHAEFLPVQLLKRDGVDYELPYYTCHLLDKVDCFDFERSKFSYRDKDKNWIDEITQLVIDDEKASGHHLYRVDISQFLIASSDSLASAASELSLSGAVFVQPNDWNGVTS